MSGKGQKEKIKRLFLNKIEKIHQKSERASKRRKVDPKLMKYLNVEACFEGKKIFDEFYETERHILIEKFKMIKSKETTTETAATAE